ncbi:hypothetical protein [Pseudomonas sp. 8BK]|uniref:hypothetical protein n=1 Tax=Pseudomonas sp. 8BK TaxID=2653164 RepID=UPI0013589AE4|nr:hypothetical protein [Pseudomonas sp. 8BK]
MQPSTRKGSFIKIRGVLEIASRNPKWASDLQRDTAGTIKNSGLDLTSDEIDAVIDIIQDTSNSMYAKPEQGGIDKFPELRGGWKKIKATP